MKHRGTRVHHHPRLTLRPQAPAGERGFTLIEIIVSIAILGVIIVPLSTTMVTSFKLTANVKQNLNASISRDTLASQWASDVASVDAAGVSSVSTLACKPSGLATPNWFIVSFNSSKLTSTGTTRVRRVSYFTTGTGASADVVRTECSDATAGALATDGTSAVVADTIGTKAETGQQVFGWFDPPPGRPASERPACDEFTCGLDLPFAEPRTIGVKAQRRVFGAGVPQEAGRIISSSKSADSTTGVAYTQYDVHNTPSATELELANNELTLPPGLDPASALTVTYAIKQVETGKWLSGSLGSEDFATVAGSPDTVITDRPYVNAYYKDGQWRLPFAFKPMTYATVAQPAFTMYGGEYKVYTRLQEIGRGPKDYGGVDGFSLWVDWRQQDSIFVNGADSNCGVAGREGLTRATAVCTPIAGLALAASKARPNVLVNLANGNPYNGTVNVDGSAYADNRTLVGGFDDRWVRRAPNDSNGGRSAIVGKINTEVSPSTAPGYSTSATGIYVNGRSNFRIRQMYVDSGAAAGNGASAYGVRATGSSLIIEQSDIGAEQGSAGADGAAGTAGADGHQAQNGGKGHFFFDDWEAWLGNLFSGGSFWNGWFVTGAKGLPDPAENGTVRSGGIGGRGGDLWSDGIAGTPGGGGAVGGRGGNGSVFGTGNRPGGGGGGNENCSIPAAPAKRSTDAGCGGGGTGGTKGTSGPTATNTPQWNGTSGGDGGKGVDAGGGGGGGGGMAATNWGGGGGGGGTGGAGGVGGKGGQAGGGSFGIFVHNTSVTITDSSITAWYGGKGGNGGRGGDGGDGGRGGNGGNKDCCESTGGSGGGGGGGAGSGGGGGGGAGGPSVAIYGFLSGGSTITRPSVNSTSTLVNKGAGGGGVYGLAGYRGDEGAGGDPGDGQLAGGKRPHGGHAGIVGEQGDPGTSADPVGRNNKVWWNELDVSGYYPS